MEKQTKDILSNKMGAKKKNISAITSAVNDTTIFSITRLILID